jgi:hypothetical protein
MRDVVGRRMGCRENDAGSRVQGEPMVWMMENGREWRRWEQRNVGWVMKDGDVQPMKGSD